MKFENTEVFNFEGALRGMRNPMNSWDKSDSKWEFWEDPSPINPNDVLRFCIGKKDLQLAQRLIRAGSEHRKFMRQIFVSVDITAPAYFMAELDTYKIGTVRNSCSFMHKGVSKPFAIEDFEIDDNELVEKGQIWEAIIDTLNELRDKYLATKDYQYFRSIRQILPQSYLYKSTITMNYENLLAMCSKGQRRFHKLNEWSGIDDPSKPNFIAWARTLPYANELIFLE